MAQRGVNKVIVMGSLGQDPEIKYMPNGGAVCNISVATSEVWKDKNSGEQQEKTEWHRIVAFRKTAELIGEYFSKGSKIYIEGRLQTRKWQDKDNNDRWTTEIVADTFQFVDSRGSGSGGGSGGGGNANSGGGGTAPPADDGFEDDIPF